MHLKGFRSGFYKGSALRIKVNTWGVGVCRVLGLGV